MAEDLKQFIEEKAEETQRHFDVVAERIEGKIDTLVEGFELHTQQLDRMETKLEKVESKLENVDARLATIEITLEAVNLPMLKEKFIALEKRVAALEAKQS